MSFFSNALDKISDAVDKAQDLAADKIPALLQPTVHGAIDGKVDNFRDTTLAELPRSCEDSIKQQADSSSVSWLFDKVLGDNTDVLVGKLVEMFRPGVTNATDGLSDSATKMILDKLKDILDGSDEPEGEQAPVEAGTRELAAETEGDGSTSRGIGSTLMGAASSAFKLDGRMPGFEAMARETAHPLFEQLKEAIWGLVPGTVKDVVGGLVGDKPDAVAEPGEEPPPEQEERGLGSWFENKLESTLGKFMDVATGALEGPVRALINKLVDELEESSMAAALKEVREKLAEWHLVSSA